MGRISIAIVLAAGWLQDRLIQVTMPRLANYYPPAAGAWSAVYNKRKEAKQHG